MMERLAFLLVCAFVFTIPWEKSIVLPATGTLTRLIGVLAFAAGSAAVLVRRQIRGPNLPLAIAILFVCWSACTWFWSFDPAATAARAFTYVQLLVMVWLVWDFARTGERQIRLLQMYVAGAVVASGATLFRYYVQQQTYYRRYAAPGFDPNDLAITVAIAIPLALYLALRTRGSFAWVYRAAVALYCAAILLTASRTALIAGCAGVVFVLCTWRMSDRVQRASSLLLLALLPAGALWLAPSAARQRIATLPTEIAQGTLHKRTQIWKTGLKVLKQRPILGAGAGAYPDAVHPWLGVPGVPGHEYVAHNTFLSVAVETGMIGAVVYGALLLAVAAFVWIMPTREQALWATTLLVWAIGAVMLTWEHRKPGWLILALIMTFWARAFDPEPERNSVPE